MLLHTVTALLLASAAACASTGPAATNSARSSTGADSPTPTPAPATVTISHFHAAKGSVITLAVFGGSVTYRLHGGSVDPGYPAISGLLGGPRVRRIERGRLLAAFNGGFELSTGAGGYVQEGRVVRRLVPGLASLVIDRSGDTRHALCGGGVAFSAKAAMNMLTRSCAVA